MAYRVSIFSASSAGSGEPERVELPGFRLSNRLGARQARLAESRASLTAKADEAVVPDDSDAPVAGTRLGALSRTKTGLAALDYSNVKGLGGDGEEDSRGSGEEGSGQSNPGAADQSPGLDDRSPQGGGRRTSIISLVKEAIFGGGGDKEPSKKSTAKERHLRARSTTVFDQDNTFQLRDMEGLASAPRSQIFDDPRLATGEAAYVIHYNALRAANVAKPLARTIGGKQVSPISRGYELVKDQVEFGKAQSDDKALNSRSIATKSLAEWLEAGLQLAPGGDATEGKRPVPPGYEIAPWASAMVPLIRHKPTGVICWPIRLDLVPLFEEVAGTHKEGFGMNTTTVYYYTSAGGFNRLVAPPRYFSDDTEAEAQLIAEEVWDRIEEDLHHHSVPPIEGAPEFSLAMLSSDPSKFTTREGIARAVYRTNQGRFGPGRVGHCVALQVPSERCMAVPGKQYTDTVVLLPPVHDESQEHERGGIRRIGRLVRWAHRHGKAKVHGSVTAEVKGMNLLDGLVNRETGQVDMRGLDASSAQGTARRPHLDSAGSGSVRQNQSGRQNQSARDKQSGRQNQSQGVSADSARNTAATPGSKIEEEEDPDEKLRTRLHKLQQEQQLIQCKIRHAERAQGKLEAGKQVKFLATDAHRLESLQRRLVKCKLQVQQVQRELEVYGEGEEEGEAEEPEEDDGGEGEGGEAQALGKLSSRKSLRKNISVKRRRRRVKVNGLTLFSDDVQDIVNDVGDEYELQSGDIFREVFGGNIEGVKAFLQDESNELNVRHPSIGWTPLHMAVSMGDPDMVLLILKNHGDVAQPTAEQGWCPVHFAVWKNSVDLLKILIKSDDDCVKHRTKAGETPLFISIQSSSVRIREEMVRELLRAHADPNAKTNAEWTPLALAVVRNYQAEVKQLVQNRGNVFDECPDEPGKCIWQASARHPGLQDLIRGKLNSRDLHIVEKRWPGSLGHKSFAVDDDKGT